MAARIYVVANNSRANRSREAPAVAHYLGETRRGIATVYRNPNVQEAAKTIKKDTGGNRYEFGTEMAGDEAAYIMTLAALTGNTNLLNAAIERMSLIIDKAEEPTAKTLAQFRRNRLAYRVDRTKEMFVALGQSYREATKASEAIDRWERVATIASRYAIDSISGVHPVEALKGTVTYLKAVVKDRSAITIFPREVAKAVTESIRHKNWRKTTPLEANYSDLQLP